jgi:heme-degrading monooxygenase HmoA
MGCRGLVAAAGPREEATVEEHFVWMTTRQLKPGTLAEFERAWRPDTHPEGMLRAYAYWSADDREIIGVSFWASQELYEAWPSSGSEARRREAMAGYAWRSRSGSTVAESSTCPMTSSYPRPRLAADGRCGATPAGSSPAPCRLGKAG